jgi:bifunctional DNA-binding transcriptional regulator/antitoxin component of YhaV-PrlF toxin-antitoxin module
MQDYSRPVTVRVRARGQVTIPQELREQMDLAPDATLRMIRIGRTLVISPTPSKRAALARQFQASMKASGVTLDDLLEELRTQRERYFDESYAGEQWEEA